MYFLDLILSFISVLILSRFDRYATIILNGEMEGSSYDPWMFNLKGRKKIYLIFLFICLIPDLNILIIFISLLAIMGIFFILLFSSKKTHNIIDKIKKIL